MNDQALRLGRPTAVLVLLTFAIASPSCEVAPRQHQVTDPIEISTIAPPQRAEQSTVAATLLVLDADMPAASSYSSRVPADSAQIGMFQTEHAARGARIDRACAQLETRVADELAHYLRRARVFDDVVRDPGARDVGLRLRLDVSEWRVDYVRSVTAEGFGEIVSKSVTRATARIDATVEFELPSGEIVSRFAVSVAAEPVSFAESWTEGRPDQALDAADQLRASLRGYGEELCGEFFAQILLETAAARPTIVARLGGVATPVAARAVRPPSEPPARTEALSRTWSPDSRRLLWGLAVGVGRYQTVSIPALPYARADAERVHDWLVGHAGGETPERRLRVLYDEQATRANVLAEIDWLRKQALPEDAVCVYLASHGAPELAEDGESVEAKYLILYDTDPEQLFATGLPLDELNRRLDSVKATTQVVILEACYAGPVGQQILARTPTADLDIKARPLRKLGERRGRTVLTASSGRQMAIGSRDLGAGLFTHALLEAWGDGRRPLLSTCFDDARYAVRRASNRLGSFQEPAKFGDHNQDLVLRPER